MSRHDGTAEPSGRGRAVAAFGVAAGSATIAAAGAYWTHMSPYSQRLGAFPYRATVAPRDRTIALTFDDGPNEPYTSQIASYLDECGIKATFFQVGRCVQRHPATTRALHAAGHLIGNHSYSHQFKRGWSKRDLLDEVRRSQQIFHDILGCQPALYRPPWLIRNPALFDILDDHALQAVSGEFCHAFEPVQPAAERIARRALAKIRSGAIVIFHDGYDAKGAPRDHTVAAVKIVVDTLTDRGFSFATVDRLLGTPAYCS
jgi:peptidoglycan/xylan/chitin deacetylase (PgdA/CDA1 family)